MNGFVSKNFGTVSMSIRFSVNLKRKLTQNVNFSNLLRQQNAENKICTRLCWQVSQRPKDLFWQTSVCAWVMKLEIFWFNNSLVVLVLDIEKSNDNYQYMVYASAWAGSLTLGSFRRSWIPSKICLIVIAGLQSFSSSNSDKQTVPDG